LKVPRGKYRGERVYKPVKARAFRALPGCGGWIDLRNLGQVLDHTELLPHPAEDRPQ
jgi:hypothetical protein